MTNIEIAIIILLVLVAICAIIKILFDLWRSMKPNHTHNNWWDDVHVMD